LELKIGNQRIGTGHPAFIIAEACDNHLGDLSVAKEMARGAKLAGADAVKYQHHLPDEEMLRDMEMSDNFDEHLYDFLKKYALTLEQHAELKAYCDSIDMTYMCTPFSALAAEELRTIGLDVFKIGSGEMTDLPSLRRIGALGCPMIVSTGMCTFEEIRRTYEFLRAQDVPLALTNCVSEYPPVYEDLNLGVIPKMIEAFPEAVIGHSDHTPDLYTCFAAVTLGAKIIEKHITLDKRRPGPDQSVSIDMVDLHSLVDGVRKIEASLGDQKKVHGKEEAVRSWAFRSIVTIQPIQAGETLSVENLWTKRPGTGIPSAEFDDIVGKKAVRDLPANVLLKREDVAE